MTDPTPAAPPPAPGPIDPAAALTEAELALLPAIRRRSIEILAAMPAATFAELRNQASWAVNYRENKRPQPGSVEEVILERKVDALVRAIEALGHDQDQAADMAGLLMTE